MQAAPHRGLHVFVSLSLPSGTAPAPVREKRPKSARRRAICPFSRPGARADCRRSAALFAYSPGVRCRDRLPAGGKWIRTLSTATRTPAIFRSIPARLRRRQSEPQPPLGSAQAGRDSRHEAKNGLLSGRDKCMTTRVHRGGRTRSARSRCQQHQGEPALSPGR
jgi:hypothetical protein